MMKGVDGSGLAAVAVGRSDRFGHQRRTKILALGALCARTRLHDLTYAHATPDDALASWPAPQRRESGGRGFRLQTTHPKKAPKDARAVVAVPTPHHPSAQATGVS